MRARITDRPLRPGRADDTGILIFAVVTAGLLSATIAWIAIALMAVIVSAVVLIAAVLFALVLVMTVMTACGVSHKTDIAYSYDYLPFEFGEAPLQDVPSELCSTKNAPEIF